MDEQKTTNFSRKLIFAFAFIIACLVVGVVVFKIISLSSGSVQGSTPSPKISADPLPDQTFSSDGFSFAVPASWYIESSATDSVAVYPEYDPQSSSSQATCKIELSAFPFGANANFSDWISSRLDADPSVAVVEQSSDAITIGVAQGVKWRGIINGIPTTLIYATDQDHAYEIAPSVIGETGAGADQCDDAVDVFLSKLII